jgi:hypothetical protein
MKKASNSPAAWDAENPHPLSRMKTELVWEGKYDEYGNRRPIKLPASPLPLQRIETIDEPHDRAKATLANTMYLFISLLQCHLPLHNLRLSSPLPPSRAS